jgi:hypothetical protein
MGALGCMTGGERAFTLQTAKKALPLLCASNLDFGQNSDPDPTMS